VLEELEMIDADNRKVAALLGALPRVEAPANFEFRVKAGIAKGSPLRSGFMPFLRTAAPLALVLVVLTFGLLYYQGPNETTVDPAKNMAGSVPVIPPAQSDAAPVIPPAQTEPVPDSSQSVTLPSQEGATRPLRASSERDPAGPMRRTAVSASSNSGAGGGSVDRIYHSANVIMPPGFESANPQNRNANVGVTSTDVPVREVLGILGVTTDFTNGGWKVRSVKENSVGYGAKIVAGDVIESIDGQPVKNDAKLKGSAKTFTVRRDGKLITLSAGN
jgi:hypothetical protein